MARDVANRSCASVRASNRCWRHQIFRKGASAVGVSEAVDLKPIEVVLARCARSHRCTGYDWRRNGVNSFRS